MPTLRRVLGRSIVSRLDIQTPDGGDYSGPGVIVGALAGVWTGTFGFILILFGLAGAEALMKSYAQFVPKDAQLNMPAPGIGSVLINLLGVVVDIIFRAIGGLIGGLIFRTKPVIPPAAG